MHQGTVGRVGQPGGQPLHQLLVSGQFSGIGQFPLPLPAAELPGQVARWTAEVAESDGLDVHAMDTGHRLSQEVRELASLFLREHGAILGGPQHEAVDEPHEIERRPDDVGIGAAGQRDRHRNGGSGQRGQHPVFAIHVVRSRQHVPEGRAAEHDLPAIEVEPVGEVGPAAGDELHSLQLT